MPKYFAGVHILEWKYTVALVNLYNEIIKKIKTHTKSTILSLSFKHSNIDVDNLFLPFDLHLIVASMFPFGKHLLPFVNQYATFDVSADSLYIVQVLVVVHEIHNAMYYVFSIYEVAT